MIRNPFTLLVALTPLCALTACGEAVAPFTSAGAPVDPFTSGPIVRLSVPDDGQIPGLTEVQTTIVREGDLGFAYGAGLIDSVDVSGSGTLTRGYHAVAGPLAGNNLGLPVDGSASYSGRYEVIYVPAATTLAGFEDTNSEISTGTVQMEFDLPAVSMTATTVVATGEPITIANGVAVSDTVTASVSHRGAGGILNGRVGQSGAVGTLSGQNAAGFFAGGFVVTP